MSKHVTVSLGGAEYKVPMLNLDQLERVEDAINENPKKAGFRIVKIGLERAEPKVDPDMIEARHTEVLPAASAILELSGYELKNAKTPAKRSGKDA